MITASQEETRRLMKELAREMRVRQRSAIGDALTAARDYIRKYGWSPDMGKRFGDAGTVAQAIHHGWNPTVEVYCLARNSVAEYVNGNDEGWLERPDSGLRPDLAKDVIAWEEGQSTETVLQTLDEMLTIHRGFDEDYAEFVIEQNDENEEADNG